MKKTYHVIFELGGQIVSDFNIEAVNKNQAKSLAQMHKRQFAREQSKAMTAGRIKTNVISVK